jgi:hypothetical protein
MAGVLVKKRCYDQLFLQKAVCSLRKKPIFGENILKSITWVPESFKDTCITSVTVKNLKSNIRAFLVRLPTAKIAAVATARLRQKERRWRDSRRLSNPLGSFHSRGEKYWKRVEKSRVARFVFVQNTKTGKNYQITTNYTKCP